jgi:D-xylose transport system permease protein
MHDATETPATETPAAETPAEPAPEADIAEVAATSPSAELLVDSVGDYLRAWGQRIRSGDSGALPILVGLALIVVVFQSQNGKFLSAGNLVNLLVEAAVFVLLGMAEIYALLLSEIDLSVGYVAAVGAFVVAEAISQPYSWPWWGGVLAGLAACCVIGAIMGTLITRLHIPSFVVTLGGLLGFQGLMLYLANRDKAAVGGVINISITSPIYKLVNANIGAFASWVTLVVLLVAFAVVTLVSTARRRARGLSAPPMSITVLKLTLTAAAGVVLVAICNVNRGLSTPLRGVPWVVPYVLVILLAWSLLLNRSRLGRYIYAIGANPEAARRSGINVPIIRTLAFTLVSLTAGFAGIAYESRLGSMATDVDGGTLVLFAVAAAVIGGTSLFGGRGKPIHALLGGLVIAAVANGLALVNVSAAGQDMATALVLVAAVAVDSLVRRRGVNRP